MENDNFKKGIEQIRKIRMTAEEKSRIFNNVVSLPVSKPVKSPYVSNVWAWLSRPAQVSIAAILVLILVGGGVVQASERSLPGEALYNVKINITEPIRGAFKITPVAKAEWEAEKADRRLKEAEELAGRGELTASTSEQIGSLLKQHTEALDHVEVEVHSGSDDEKIREVRSRFSHDMNSHAEELSRLASSSRQNEDNHGSDDLIKEARHSADVVSHRNQDNQGSNLSESGKDNSGKGDSYKSNEGKDRKGNSRENIQKNENQPSEVNQLNKETVQIPEATTSSQRIVPKTEDKPIETPKIESESHSGGGSRDGGSGRDH